MNLENQIIYKFVIYIICVTLITAAAHFRRTFTSLSKRILRFFLGKPAYLSLSSEAAPPPKGHLTLE